MRPSQASSLLLLPASLVVAIGLPPPDGRLTSSFQYGHDDSAPAERPFGRMLPSLTRLRDAVIEAIFGVPPGHGRVEARPESQWPGAVDVVMRYNYSTLEEETALEKAVFSYFLDVWSLTGEHADVMVPDYATPWLRDQLPGSLRPVVLMQDVGQTVRDSVSGRVDSLYRQQREGLGELFFQDYRPLGAILQWMKLLQEMYPAIVEVITIGHSFENRPITALRIAAPKLEPDAPRKTIVISGGMHAREWISTSTVNYVAYSLVTSYGREALMTRFLEDFDVVLVPTLNPDGVEYTWKVDRLWRKTRQPVQYSSCVGIDLDHAFGYEWGPSFRGPDPCSGSYGGRAPFEAVEARQLASWARNETEGRNVRFVGLLDLHSYSQQILYPFAFSCIPDPPNLEKLQELGVGLAKAIRLSNGESYRLSPACEGATTADNARRLELSGGSAIDWFYHELHAHYSFQIKLRDTGSYGFLLPREDIVPTGEEMFSAVKYYADYLLGNNGIEEHPGFTAQKEAGQEERLELRNE